MASSFKSMKNKVTESVKQIAQTFIGTQSNFYGPAVGLCLKEMEFVGEWICETTSGSPPSGGKPD